MKKITMKFFATILTLVIGIASTPLTSFASDIAFDYEYEMADEYKEELRIMGFQDSDIIEFTRINNQLALATNCRDRDNLMKQYHELVDGTLFAAASSIYSPNGGTLNLNYTGNMSAISNVIYTKVVYMSNVQVEYYQKAMNSPGFLNWIANEGIGIVTGAAAAKIAAYLGISSSGLTWLIGLPISATFFILQNLETWDLNDAIDRSSTGKVKLEYYYMTSISYPYYQEFENFEPWNSNYVSVPANYTYSYSAGVYNYD